MDLIADRPDKSPHVQEVRESLFAKMGRSLNEIFRGTDRLNGSVQERLKAGRQAANDYK